MAEIAKTQSLEYYLERNDREHVRLDEQSRGIYELLGNRFTVTPLQQPERIADVGCGTGIVTAFLGNQYPDTKVVGIDLYPDPGTHKFPENVTFVQGNVEQVLTQHPEVQPRSFDYVFSRLLVFGFKSWPERIKDIAAMIKPGGYYECQECTALFMRDGVAEPTQPRWIQEFHKAAKAIGLDFDIPFNASQFMKEAGLEVVQRLEYPWTVGDWLAKERPETKILGTMLTSETQTTLLRLADQLLCNTHSEAEISEIKRDLRSTVVNSPGLYLPYTIIVGRKPLEVDVDNLGKVEIE